VGQLGHGSLGKSVDKLSTNNQNFHILHEQAMAQHKHKHEHTRPHVLQQQQYEEQVTPTGAPKAQQC
jgi:hypothetical protein